jgi:hypothetical protein
MYLSCLSGWEELEKLFSSNGLSLELGLDNEPYFEDKHGEWVEYDNLSEELKSALQNFLEINLVDY